MPDQEKRVEKVNIGADFTLRYCEYLPWLDLERGRVRYHPLCHSCGRIAAASDPGTRGTVSRPGARLTGNNFNNMSPIVTSVTRTLATVLYCTVLYCAVLYCTVLSPQSPAPSTQGGLQYSTVQYRVQYSTCHRQSPQSPSPSSLGWPPVPSDNIKCLLLLSKCFLDCV